MDRSATVDNPDHEPPRSTSPSVQPPIVETMFDTATDPLEAAGVGEPAATATLQASALVEVIGSAHRLESILVARRLAAVAALLQQRLPSQSQPIPSAAMR
ncbi:hypothetical protein I553_5808 [Mycobacterium xenopi 4042]|uniref:Uncharacterized protein n=1 Tax=Mycobacterium xenopi 4042 TaxID=1299334 RepID=X7ZXV7_MYCXE|nr:hypothetical protein I553_5808 [Mycobacterium xenopi 4042]